MISLKVYFLISFTSRYSIQVYSILIFKFSFDTPIQAFYYLYWHLLVFFLISAFSCFFSSRHVFRILFPFCMLFICSLRIQLSFCGISSEDKQKDPLIAADQIIYLNLFLLLEDSSQVIQRNWNFIFLLKFFLFLTHSSLLLICTPFCYSLLKLNSWEKKAQSQLVSLVSIFFHS